MPRTKEQFEAMKMASVEKINETGIRLFAHKGIAGTSINEIAKEAGISVGLMYHYYKSKEDLYTELVKTAICSAREFLVQLQAEEKTPTEKIEAFTKNISDGLGNQGTCVPYYYVLIEQAILANNLPKGAEEYTEMAFDNVYILQSIIEAGQKTGEIKQGDSQSLAILYLSAIQGLNSFKLMAKNSFPLPDPSWINNILINKK